jgi:protein-disulfide isomerase
MRFLLLLLPAALLAAQLPGVQKKTAPEKNFKESGSPNAPVTIEVYADYECPHCRAFYLEVLPPLIAEFVKTGKVRLIHRDFPLPSQSSAKLAARYANAAGHIGRYDVVATQIFQTQPDWSQNGNVDGAVAKVLSPSEMETVRSLVKDDPTLDDTVKQDVEAGVKKDHLTATPTIVIAYKGKRDVIAGDVEYEILKSYINAKLNP